MLCLLCVLTRWTESAQTSWHAHAFEFLYFIIRLLSLFLWIYKQTPYKTGWALTRVSSGSADHVCPFLQLCLNSQYFTVYLWPNNPRSFTIDCIYIRIWWALKTPGPPTDRPWPTHLWCHPNALNMLQTIEWTWWHQRKYWSLLIIACVCFSVTCLHLGNI